MPPVVGHLLDGTIAGFLRSSGLNAELHTDSWTVSGSEGFRRFLFDPLGSSRNQQLKYHQRKLGGQGRHVEIVLPARSCHRRWHARPSAQRIGTNGWQCCIAVTISLTQDSPADRMKLGARGPATETGMGCDETSFVISKSSQAILRLSVPVRSKWTGITASHPR